MGVVLVSLMFVIVVAIVAVHMGDLVIGQLRFHHSDSIGVAGGGLSIL